MGKQTLRLDPFGIRLIKKMVSKNLLKEDDVKFLQEAKKSAELTTGELILEHKLMNEQKLIVFLSEEFGCPSINPNNFLIDNEVLRAIPANFAHNRGVVPVTMKDNVLTVAMENPADLTLIDDLKAVTNLRIRPTVALSKELNRALKKYYPASSSPDMPKPEEMIDELVRIVQESKAQEGSSGAATLLQQAQETPVIKISNLLILDAIRRKASDLFIEPWEKSVRVRCRVDGILEEIAAPPKSMSSAIVSRFKVMSSLDIAERRIPQDGRFKIKVQDREVDIRVSIIPTSFGEKVCLRILDRKAQSEGLDNLGFTKSELATIKECAIKPHGMILVTGPTGSGKTTTLYSVLGFLDAIDKNITTVEDPVEYETDGINQVNVRDSIGLSFSAALRSILRQDPDIILIGEIRDLTTMDIAIKSALTGHLVLSTLHTNDTVGAIVRMRNMGIEPFLITSSVLMISAQRLLRRLCPSCRKETTIEAKKHERLSLDSKGKNVFYRPIGCKKCRSTGYQGRTVITEILRMTPAIKTLTLQNASGEDIKREARKEGMTTLRECGIRKALAGETSIDEVLRLTADDAPMKGGKDGRDVRTNAA